MSSIVNEWKKNPLCNWMHARYLLLYWKSHPMGRRKSELKILTIVCFCTISVCASTDQRLHFQADKWWQFLLLPIFQHLLLHCVDCGIINNWKNAIVVVTCNILMALRLLIANKFFFFIVHFNRDAYMLGM